MPSVDVVWKGRCNDRQLQQELCEHLLQLSKISNQKFSEFFGEQVNTIFFNETEDHIKYLISTRVVGNELPPARIKEVDKGIYLVSGIALFGLEFPLYDPRNFTLPFGLGTGNRMSFVFARSEDPYLDGRLVQVFPVNELHRLSEMTHFALVNPSLDLRYYLEGWIRDFLGWVKFFYIPGLYYWHWSDCPGYDGKYKDVTKNKATAAEHFSHLLETFLEEAESFTQYYEDARRKLKNQWEESKVKPKGDEG